MPEGRCEASRRQTKPDWSLVDIYPAAASPVWAASPRGPVRVLGQFMHALHPDLQDRHVRRRQSTAWTRRRAGRRRCWPYRGLPALRRECQAVCTNGIDTTWSRGAHVGASISHPPSHVSAPSVPGHRHPSAANKVEDKRLNCWQRPNHARWGRQGCQSGCLAGCWRWRTHFHLFTYNFLAARHSIPALPFSPPRCAPSVALTLLPRLVFASHPAPSLVAAGRP